MLNRKPLQAVLPALLSILLVSPASFGDIFQWEWVNPADPSQGKQASSTLCPDGAGLDPLPGLYAPSRNLNHAWLANSDLTGARFSTAALTEADFTWTNLSSASFYNATLTNADFTWANLSGASFYNATLTNADFTRTNLTDANFYIATLTNADFTGATIAGADFSDTTDEGFTRAQFESTTSYVTGSLAGISLSYNDLSSWNFAGMDLTDADFNDATLTDTDFTQANLSNIDFRWATLTNADFTGATIAGADFSYTTNQGLTRAQFESTASYITGNLAGVGLGFKELSSWNFADMDLINAHFNGASLTNADFTQANLTGAYFNGATLTNTNFTGATIAGANFGSTTDQGFTRAQFESTTSYVTGSLAGIRLSYNDLSSWNFAGKNLTDADFYNATLTNADFTGTTIAGADFSDTTDQGFTRAQFESTASYVTGDLAGVGLRGNDLSSWNFTDMDLTDADFYSATLTNADFTGTTIAGANFGGTTNQGFTRAQLESTASYVTGSLTGIRLSYNDLSSWNFTDMDLTDAYFYYATLTNAYFTRANLTDADFEGATLANADFTGATIAGADFGGTTDQGFTRTQFESTASYVTDSLAGIRLGSNDMSSWNFANMDLTDAYFWEATLTDADFTRTNLTDADFERATLENADFMGATIARVNFSDTTDKGFTRAQFESTASYASGDLAGMQLGSNDLSSWNFANMDLTDADFYHATLTDTDFTQANLTDTSFRLATLTDVDLTGADARGADAMSYSSAASLHNFVQPSGQVAGLNIAAGEQFRVWDYDGKDTDGDDVPDTLLGITVLDQFIIDDAGLLIVGLEDDVWGSTIAFDPGISVIFDGTLEVELRNGFMPIAGDQWRLFDFAGVTPTGGFDTFVLPTLADGMQWDTANLMNTGVLTVVPEPASLLLMTGALTATTIRRRR